MGRKPTAMQGRAGIETRTRIRRAAASDVRDLASLVSEYWAFEHIAGFERARVESGLCALIATPQRGGCWIAERAGSPAGYLIAVYLFSLEHGGTMAEIDELFVRPESRSAGTATALLMESEREMTIAGISRVQLQVGVTNERARGFYARRGFRARSDYELFDKRLPGGRNERE